MNLHRGMAPQGGRAHNEAVALAQGIGQGMGINLLTVNRFYGNLGGVERLGDRIGHPRRIAVGRRIEQRHSQGALGLLLAPLAIVLG